MCSVGPSSAFDSLVHCSVGNDAFINFESFGFSVGEKVFEESKAVTGALFWPSTKGLLPSLCLSGSSDVSRVDFERNHLLVLKNVFIVANRFLQTHALNSAGCLVRVLEVSSQVVNSGFSGYTIK
jgi:hypothetical protein